MFDPSIGRWLEEDPLQFQAGDPSLYRDVRNNPTNATDPSGLESAYYASLAEQSEAFLRFGAPMARRAAALATAATRQARERFKPAELADGKGDAWRHCFWSALMQVDPILGKRGAFKGGDGQYMIVTNYRDPAFEIGLLHEEHGNRNEQPVIEFSMDMHNNGVGLRIGKQLGIGASAEEVVRACNTALDDGSLIWIENGELTGKATYQLIAPNGFLGLKCKQ